MLFRQKMKIYRQSLRSWSDGFTFIETLFALFIFSLIGAVLVLTVNSSVKHSGVIGGKTQTLAKAYMFDSYARLFVSRIQAPFWGCDFTVEPNGTSVEINYLDGNSKNTFQIKSSDKSVLLSAGETSLLFKNLEILTIEVIGKESNPLGISISYIFGNRNFEMKALFSSFLLRDNL